MFDVIIIGAGPIGLACGIAAKRRSLDVLILEKGALVNSLTGYPTNMEFFSTPDLLEIGGHPLPTTRYKPIREEAIDYYRRVAETEKLDVHLYEPVVALEGEDDTYTVITDKAHYECRKVVIATGFFDVPNLMCVPGEDMPKVTHYYREPYAYTGQEVAVIGAKNSAAKAALDCFRHGAKVTMIVRGPELSDSIKYWIKPDLENRIKEGSIKVLFNTSVEAIRPTSLVLKTPEGPKEIANDWVVALTGYQPDYSLLDKLGVTFADDVCRTPICDPETFETERPGVYLAGTVGGGLNTSRWFIENARFHADHIMDDIAQEKVEAIAAV
ncbi:MAG TPA: YpdA family putative bacillithiol disulfide reductase [Rhodothermales bacterium]|nr:YpdA family putative bacillithiol disulfide reductase [Rhodothermales bacterium]